MNKLILLIMLSFSTIAADEPSEFEFTITVIVKDDLNWIRTSFICNNDHFVAVNRIADLNKGYYVQLLRQSDCKPAAIISDEE